MDEISIRVIFRCSKACPRHTAKCIQIEDLTTFSEQLSSLENFEPKINQPINEIYNYKKGCCKDLDNWLDDWNSKFKPTFKKVITVMKKKLETEVRVQTKQDAHFKRVWSEVFKFLSLEEVLQMKLVSKLLYEITWTKDLWKFLCRRDFGTTEVRKDYVEFYAELSENTCFGCKEKLQDFKLQDFKRCSLTKKFICSDCLQNNPDFKVITTPQEIRNLKGINPSLLSFKRLSPQGSPAFKTYKFYVDIAAQQFRKGVKQELLERTPEDTTIYNFIKNINTHNMDEAVQELNPDCERIFNCIKTGTGKSVLLGEIRKLAFKY